MTGIERDGDQPIDDWFALARFFRFDFAAGFRRFLGLGRRCAVRLRFVVSQ